MVELDQFRYRISGYDKPMAQIKKSLDLDNKQKRIEELEADMEAPGFWDNPDKSQNAMKELKGLKDAFERYNELETGLDDVKTLIEMAEESNDQSLIPEIEEEITNLEDKMESLRIETLLSGEHDACDAILTLHAGAGGTESCDWCQMLFRMYTRWAESHGYTTETLDYLEGEEAGIKSVTIEIRGENAYGHLKSVQGIHLGFQLHRATGTGTGNCLICSSYHAGNRRKTTQCRNRYYSDDGGAVWIGNDAMMMQSIFRVDFRNN